MNLPKTVTKSQSIVTMYSLLNPNQLYNPPVHRHNQKHRLIPKISGVSSLFLGIYLLLMVLVTKPISHENTDISAVVIASRDCLGYIGLAIVMFFGTNWSFLDSSNGLTINLNCPDHNPTFNSYVKFHRLVKKLILLVTSIYYYLVYDLFFIALDRRYFIEKSYLSRYMIHYVFNLLLGFLAILAHSGAIYLFNIIYDGIIILNGSFKCFNQQLIDLHGKRPSLDQLGQLRCYYSYLIQSTLKFDQFARYEICRLYINSISAYLFGLLGLFIHKNEKTTIISIILIFLFDSLIVIVLTLNSIMLNKNCHQELETLYELSLPMRSAIYRSEVILFYNRLSKNDVGLTFLNIFTLKPNFVLSIVTLALTIFLAIPSFIPLILK
uniref:Gustatory receptor n=1 Tax=Tetranychus urticae TaxID=32264 RepID=T1L1K2_TETUR